MAPHSGPAWTNPKILNARITDLARLFTPRAVHECDFSISIRTQVSVSLCIMLVLERSLQCPSLPVVKPFLLAEEGAVVGRCVFLNVAASCDGESMFGM